MTAISPYPGWSSTTPRTDPNARACRFRDAIKVRAVRIQNGRYRNAVADGIFELADAATTDPVEVLPGGKSQVRVLCAWHGCRPNDGVRGLGARIDVGNPSGAVQVIESYSGLVVDNIGDPTDPPPNEWENPSTAGSSGTSYDMAPPSMRLVTTINRIVRDTALSRRAKELSGFSCRICGNAISLRDGTRYVEAHHIQPLGEPHNGPDILENILCLCPNHHAACDLGAIELRSELLAPASGHEVGEEFLDYHNARIWGMAASAMFASQDEV